MLSKENKVQILRRIRKLEEGTNLRYKNSSLMIGSTLKALYFLIDHGYLSLKCEKCGTRFFCSGICLYQQNSSVHVTDSEKGKCLCSKCDHSGKEWISKCKKSKNSLFYLFAYFAESKRKKGIKSLE